MTVVAIVLFRAFIKKSIAKLKFITYTVQYEVYQIHSLYFT